MIGDRYVSTGITCRWLAHRDAWAASLKFIDAVRSWTCGHCNTLHDRDGNAARNVLLAAGLADRRNGCGAPVSLGRVPAQRSEAATHRSPA